MRIHFAIATTILLFASLFVRPAMVYNCHSLAWHDGWGDRTDPGNYWFKPRWDDCPCDDMPEAIQVGYLRPGDIIVYGDDNNGDGQLGHGEIRHSGEYLGHDLVQSKVGYGPIIYHCLDEQIPAYGNTVEYWRRTSFSPAQRTAPTHEKRESLIWQDVLMMLDMQP